MPRKRTTQQIERDRRYCREWRKRNLEYARSRSRVWYRKNQRKVKDYHKRYSKRRNMLRRAKYASNQAYRERMKRVAREYRKKHPDRAKDVDLKRVFGIRLFDYKLLVAVQNGECAICKRKTKLHVDHCHSSKYIRGLLCTKCNMGLGLFCDDPEILRSAATYIERFTRSAVCVNPPSELERLKL